MVSENYSKEPAPTFRHQGLISSMNPSPVHSEHLGNGLQFQQYSVPPCVNSLGEQIYRPEVTNMSSLINGEVQKGNSHLGVSCGNGHGLSLTLGSRLSTEFQMDGAANAMNSNYSRSDSMTCESESNSRVHDAPNSCNPTFSGMLSALFVLQRSPYRKPAQQLLDEIVCLSNAIESGSDRQLRKHFKIAMADGRLHLVGESTDRPEEKVHLSDEKNAVRAGISRLISLLEQVS